MTNLIQKLIGRKQKGPGISVSMSTDEINPFFERFGIDTKTIGFPEIETRTLIPLEKYWMSFKNVMAFPIIRSPDADRKQEIVITGNYEVQPVASYQDENGFWRPGWPSKYSFIIRNGELNLTNLN